MDRTRNRWRDDRRRYGRDETADILDLAAALESSDAERQLDLSRDDLYRIARELGISESAVDAAIDGSDRTSRVEAKTNRRSVRRRMRFIRHALAYVITVSILAVVDALGGGGWWFFYIAAIWGIVLALHGMRFVTRRNGPLEQRLVARASVEP